MKHPSIQGSEDMRSLSSFPEKPHKNEISSSLIISFQNISSYWRFRRFY